MAIDELVRFYQTLTPERLSRLANHYHPNARFKDPFNDVRGVDAIRRVFEHMYRQVESPRFVITEHFSRADGAALVWEMHFDLRRRGHAQPRVIRGMSLLGFDRDGLVTVHRDYWDAAEELYQSLPLIGRLMRVLRRAFATPVS